MKHDRDGRFRPIKIADVGGRIAAGRFIQGARYPQVVINSGDGIAPLKWYECRGDPDDPKSWAGHDLVGRDVIHGHSLQVADIDGDGHRDIFAAEVAKWSESGPDPDNPPAKGRLFHGGGPGNFLTTALSRASRFDE